MKLIDEDFSKPYSRINSWFYDRMFAGVTLDSVLEMQPDPVEQLRREVGADGTVLDVGCGGGQFALALAERIDRLRVVGVDLSAEQVGWANKRANGLGDRATFQRGTADELEFADGTFDAAVSIGSIKHWRDPRKGLAEMIRVLRPGGLLNVIEIDRGCLLSDVRALLGRLPVTRFTLGLGVMGFRTFVAGRSIDLDDAQRFVLGLPLADVSVRRIPGEPNIQILGHKQAS
ncbi:class I SAM-dependent methyltransferase [Amycolatopsis nigrescens]|uniref:class I SAM-dependent methyltransferase n=1 Tax=Amycolatopsis nigrescens TaxID=381445 RepID=UPI0003821F47|nr:class I SAM-dependent methyltransferase [Amycolatopsis nigrescens]